MELINIGKIATPIIGILVFIRGLHEYQLFRKDKYRISFDVEAEYRKLTENELETFYRENGKHPKLVRRNLEASYLVEVTLKFKNEGNVRIKLFNIQVAIKTLRSLDELCFSKRDEHLKLESIHNGNNIVPIKKVPKKWNRNKFRPTNKTSFYFIEPGVEQCIRHVTMIKKPLKIIQVEGKFNFEQERMDLCKKKIHHGLHPHTATKLYFIDK